MLATRALCSLVASALAAFALAASAQQAPTLPTAGAQSAPVTVDVKRFVINDLTLVSEAEAQRALAPWLGERGIDELHAAAAAVQRLFARMGYASVMVYLPPQKIEQGTVNLQVVASKLVLTRVHPETVDVKQRASILASLPALRRGETPNLLALDAQLRLVHQNPAKRLDVLLLPGDEPASTNAELVLQPAESLVAFSATADNTGDERTGRWRLGAEVRHANATGQDDVLSARWIASEKPGRVRVAMVAWRLPLYGPQLMIDSYVAYANIDGGNLGVGDLPLRLVGNGRMAGIRATRYLQRWRGAEHSVSAALDYRAIRNQFSLQGEPTNECGAACANLTLRPFRVGYEWQFDGPVMLGFGFEWRRNLASASSQAEAFERARAGSRANYSLIQLNARAGGAMQEDSRWQARFSAQLARKPLPGAEQFGIGGAASVRGYDERGLVGDRGAVLSVEVIGPEFATDRAAAVRSELAYSAWSLRPVGFFDAGWVANKGEMQCSMGRASCNLASVGLGLRLSHPYGSARLDAALPTKNDPLRWHFASQWRF